MEINLNNEKIERLLHVGNNGNISEQILLKAKDEMMNGNYSLSIILSETAFETYMQNILINICKYKGINELAVGKNSSLKNCNEVIMNGNIKEHLIKRYLKSMINFNVGKLKEYTLWHEYTYDVKNEIVQSSNIRLTKKSAEKALNMTIKFIKKINDLVDSRIDMVS